MVSVPTVGVVTVFRSVAGIEVGSAGVAGSRAATRGSVLAGASEAGAKGDSTSATSATIPEVSAKTASSDVAASWLATGAGDGFVLLEGAFLVCGKKSRAGKAANAGSSGASGFLICAKPAVSSSIKTRALISNRGLRSTMAVIHALLFCTCNSSYRYSKHNVTNSLAG